MRSVGWSWGPSIETKQRYILVEEGVAVPLRTELYFDRLEKPINWVSQ